MRALVVDDEIEICTMVTRHLQKLGFQAQYAVSVSDACERLANESYNIVFVDLNLNEGSGFDVIRYKNENNLTAKIVVISAYDSEASRAINEGADVFLPKPFAFKRINEILDTLNLSTNNLIS